MMVDKAKIIEDMSLIYDWIDSAVTSHRKLTGRCMACGDCCDFQAFDHRLYITTPELIYFVETFGKVALKPMIGGRCPYNVDNKCTIYDHRFAGCRIFGCKGNTPFQSQLTESILQEIKLLCKKHDIPYRYIEFAEILTNPDLLNEIDKAK